MSEALHALPHWTAGVHHDGSALYVSNTRPRGGDTVAIRLRVPADAPLSEVTLRSEPDGESHHEAMRPVSDDERGGFTYWVADLPLTMPANPYSFILRTTDSTVYRYNALGISKTRWPQLYDFTLLADFDGPAWVQDAVFYQIFPDRFHNGDPALNVPEDVFTLAGGKYRSRTVPWQTVPGSYSETGNLDFYGGDLPGIIARLDVLQDLGVTALYLNPIFTSSSTHRYNIEDFTHVDPYLGGDAALAALREALDARDMRLILDVTPNHTGSGHPWFTAAQADPRAATAAYYTFYDHPDEYAQWLHARSLPKLNYSSPAVREVMYRAPDSVLRRWLKPPYRIDGWRLDVFNMTGRQGMYQAQAEVMREMRAAVKDENPDAYLMGESFFDASYGLQGDQLDATMNYIGFTYPVWEWLSVPGFEAQDAAAQMQQFLGAIPWQVALMQFNLIGSHDVPRIRHRLGGDVQRVRLAAALLLTFPGVPCIYYGDEIGMDGPHNRAPMPWDESAWETGLRDLFKRLIALRKRSAALREGGYQVLHAAGDVLAYARSTPQERVLVLVHRGAEPLAEAVIPVGQGGFNDGETLHDALSDTVVRVEAGHITLRDLPASAAWVLVAQAGP